jgi:hypothetical protein
VDAGTLNQDFSRSQILFVFNRLPFGPSPAFDISGIAKSQEDAMETAITFVTAVGGMGFSLAVALLAEELIFGQVIRLFFSQRAVAARLEPKR